MHTTITVLGAWLFSNYLLVEFLIWRSPGAYKNDPRYIDQEIKTMMSENGHASRRVQLPKLPKTAAKEDPV